MNAVERSLDSSDEASGLSPSPPGVDDARRSLNARLLGKLLRFIGNPPLEFALGSGEAVRGSGTEQVARVVFRDRKTLLGVLADPFVRFGDAYSDGRIDIQGDLVRMIELIYQATAVGEGARTLTSRVLEWLRRPRANTLEGSRANIHHHYDIGNDFYSLWLGETMAYTCAYYPTPEASLDAAQIAKFDHVSRKLRLKPGETVVEAGCGWGGLALHMARRYGVKVRAFNISREQLAFGRERARREGLAGQVEFVEDDYRNIAGRYDAFVSVGMLEHVGVRHYPELGRVARRCLPQHGRGLIHSIGRNYPAPLHPWIEKRIFPGAYPPSLSEMSRIFEPSDLSVLDVENLRLHYAQTLRQWLELYERNVDRVRSLFDEKFVRMWRLYLAGSVAGFTMGTLQLFQVVFARRDNNDVPFTRDHLYGARAWPGHANG
jgi:cyclopropane-fatty-acyl-phospholipid synthase